VPAALLTVGRTEVHDLALPVLDGKLPDGLSGHFFVVAPASTVQWGSRPMPGQPPLMNGDGMVCRVDFSPGAARATSRIARSPCQIADQLTFESGFPLSMLRFFDAGIARLSPLLGARDFLNTAFVPICEPGQAARMLLTYDAGRPYEIDPQTLEVLGPMGANNEWAPETFNDSLFPMVLSPGHPFWDPQTRELFTVNYGRSLSSMGPQLEQLAGLSGQFWGKQGGLPQSFTHLTRWDGKSALQHWKLLDGSGNEVQIAQSVHQVAVTRNWVILFDTAFRVGFEQWFNDPFPGSHTTEELLRALLARPQLPYTTLYLVPRAQLGTGSTDPQNPTPVTVSVVNVPVESAHLLADYEDSGTQVTVHLAHCAASDLAEWLRPYDTSFFDGSSPRALVEGMVAIGAMDVNRLGRYVIDAPNGQILSGQVVYDEQMTWALALYAARELPALNAAPARYKHLFWTTAGFFPELLTKFVHGLYKQYSNRIVPLEEIAKMASEGGRPSCLIRVDLDGMQIGDSHQGPAGTIINSPQFIPKSAEGGPLDGWLVSTVSTASGSELWVYDAGKLAQGPICRLDASALGMGFSLHTAWLPTLAKRTATYRVDLATDSAGRTDHEGVRALLGEVQKRLP
jgi:carotenoid cleavage dioxygenase-like enzyme